MRICANTSVLLCSVYTQTRTRTWRGLAIALACVVLYVCWNAVELVWLPIELGSRRLRWHHRHSHSVRESLETRHRAFQQVFIHCVYLFKFAITSICDIVHVQCQISRTINKAALAALTAALNRKNTPKCFLMYSVQNVTDCDNIWYMLSWVNLSYRNKNVFRLTWIVSLPYLVKLSIRVLNSS